ncbi:hypothetical protein CDEST_08615 [Colletotrichum destructivum]|uniref:Uncharacterized protein n=1 Tax=Colletotrichum destructivum TaxID=34406 RepID=A0AAX4IJJ3_9PEZI|nr:hypothetical protein CDEST_08615 [Colletotrichum destructivum]
MFQSVDLMRKTAMTPSSRIHRIIRDSIDLYSTNEHSKSIGDGCFKNRDKQGAFAKAVNRKILSLPMTDGSDEAYEFVDIQNEQCKWTNCGAPCSSGWALMKREDKGARRGEYMLGQKGCNGKATHAFRCPPSDKLPTCGWYDHNNGKCKPECPAGTGHVGGDKMYCNNRA